MGKKGGRGDDYPNAWYVMGNWEYIESSKRMMFINLECKR